MSKYDTTHDDGDLRRSVLRYIITVLHDAVLDEEGPLTVSQIQYRLATKPQAGQMSVSRKEIEATLGWGAVQPNADEGFSDQRIVRMQSVPDMTKGEHPTFKAVWSIKPKTFRSGH